MKIDFRRRMLVFAVAVPAVALAAVQGLPAAAGLAHGAYQQTNLVVNRTGPGVPTAQHVDAHLVNPWGISATPGSPFWVSDNGMGVATLYANGNPVIRGGQQFVVRIPPPAGSPPGTTSAPTGTVFNGTSDFVLSDGKPALFFFATEDGTISAWNLDDGSQAELKVDNSGSAAVYKGLALGSNSSGNFLYATNFRAARVDVFDKSFSPAALAGSFSDPNIPLGFAPFDIQNLNGTLFVTYAKQDAAKHDDVAGPGNGFVDAFDTSGNLLRRIAAGGSLNSPWGLAIAPSGFGPFHNDLLVGNFGDGTINAFDLRTLRFQGQLGDGSGHAIQNDGLWGLRFGNGGAGGPTTTLFFTAGLNGEQDGLYGSIVSLEGD
jgi:uncharacterized protein (TIGR03118 family)